MVNEARERASKLAIILFAFVAIVVASGCDLFGGGRRGDDGGTRPDDGSEGMFAWRLGTVNRGPHRPGTWLTFPVEGITVPPDQVVLWQTEGEYGIPFHSWRNTLPARPEVSLEEDDSGVFNPLDGGLDAGRRDDFVFAMPLPITRAGVFHLAIGDTNGPLTREIEVEVVLSPPPISREEAADALVLGMTGLGDDVSALLRSDDPDWRALLTEEGVMPTVDAFDAASVDVEAMAALMRDQYLAIPAEDEPGFREMLWNAGMLESLAMRASGISMLTFGEGAFTSELLRSPLQGILFKLDVLSALLSAIALVADVATVIGAILTAPAGGEGALVGMVPKLLAAFFRAMVDTFVPCDPIEMFELQHSSQVFQVEGSMVVPWTRFAPQNVRLGSVFRSLTEVITVVLSEAIPEPGQAGLRAVLRRAAEFIVTMVPGLAMDAALDDMPVDIQIAIPLDMGFYNVNLSQVVLLHPLLTPLSVILSLVWDPELVSPYDVVARTTGARATANYETRSVGITDLRYSTPAPSEYIGATIRARAFGFGTDGATIGGAQILQFPFPYTVDRGSRFIRVQQAPDPAIRSQAISDEDMIMLDVNLPGGGTTRMIRRSTSTLRVYTMTLNDLAGGRPDNAIFDVYVGDSLVPIASGIVIPSGSEVPVPLMLYPGANDLRVVAVAGHTAIPCGPSGTDQVCTQIELPESDNVNHNLAFYGMVGAERRFRIWTPPTFPMPEDEDM